MIRIVISGIFLTIGLFSMTKLTKIECYVESYEDNGDPIMSSYCGWYNVFLFLMVVSFSIFIFNLLGAIQIKIVNVGDKGG